MVIVESHNAYECYVTSPRVTLRLIEATLQKNRDKTFGPWDPLHNILVYLSYVSANRNLVGYCDVGKLSDAIFVLIFPNSNGMLGRLRWCPKLAIQVSTHLEKLRDK